MRLLPLIPFLQAVGVFATLKRLRQWDRRPALRPSRGRLWGLHILLPLVLNLILASSMVYLRSSDLMRFLQL